jgi:hypothetical protein
MRAMLFLPTKVGSISSSSIFWKTWKGLLLMYPHCCTRDLQNLITLQTFSSSLNSQQLVLGLWSFLCFYTAPLPGISCSPQCLPAVLQHQGCLPGIQTSQNIGHRSCSPFCPWGGAGYWVFAPNGTATYGWERCKGRQNGASSLPFLALCWLGAAAS